MAGSGWVVVEDSGTSVPQPSRRQNTRVKITQECEYNIVSTLSYSTLELQLVISNY